MVIKNALKINHIFLASTNDFFFCNRNNLISFMISNKLITILLFYIYFLNHSSWKSAALTQGIYYLFYKVEGWGSSGGGLEFFLLQILDLICWQKLLMLSRFDFVVNMRGSNCRANCSNIYIWTDERISPLEVASF